MTVSHVPGRRRALAALAGVTLTAGKPLHSRAQAIAGVKLINGFPPGGVVDVLSRRVATGLVAGGYGTTAIVDNRAGAAGRIACAAVKVAPADGATLLVTPDSTLSLYPFIYARLDYDPFADFVPVGTAASSCDAFAVGPMVPDSVTSLREFIAWARRTPESAAFGSPGSGSPLHLLGALLAKESGVDLRHVAYRGAAPGVADLAGGQVAAMVAPIGNFLALQRSRKLRILATSGPRRSAFAPEVATFTEQGMAADYPAEDAWFGVFAPAASPTAMVDRAARALSRAVEDPAMAEALSNFGLVPKASAAGEMLASLKRQQESWSRIVKRIGFTPES